MRKINLHLVGWFQMLLKKIPGQSAQTLRWFQLAFFPDLGKEKASRFDLP
jgi:hypothetical protein